MKKTSRFVQGLTLPNINDSRSDPHRAEQLQFDALPIAIIRVDLNGHILFMNKLTVNLLGKPTKNLKLEDWPEKFGLYLDDGKTLYPGGSLPLARALRGEVVDESEEIILRKTDGEQGVWISISTAVLRDENGMIEGGIALIRDINYRKQIEFSREKQIQRIEALYKLSHIIAEAGNDLNEIARVAASYPAEVIGGMSVVSLLTNSKEKLKIAAFHDADPGGLALLQKFHVMKTEYDLSDGLVGGVIKIRRIAINTLNLT